MLCAQKAKKILAKIVRKYAKHVRRVVFMRHRTERLHRMWEQSLTAFGAPDGSVTLHGESVDGLLPRVCVTFTNSLVCLC